MPRTKLQDFPSKENTVTEPEQVVVNPLFAKPNALAGIFWNFIQFGQSYFKRVGKRS
ncbi:pathogenicity island DNA-binding protein [Staphylococcus aureus]|nr:pathogenicity island DNA-binding protein [Staphylococcus aureus]